MARQWTIAQIADRFHTLPSVVARALAEDPERLDAEAIPLLSYEQAYRAYHRNSMDEMKRWSGNRLMELVKENDFNSAEEELEALE